ncbi:RusA family crossover junction endodeoxyribonuclease [Streptomyces sp. DH8]|uniref:RusA family crossover junction endodeoxyribonuclease n=1 Tax=Streptomyces sp. DH8 TaxID=2857008 RepID=UPI001E45A1BB|nr:RusA family crossover junction endodeoxyribonuclease [Streptomyces sp. DH8]
MTTSWTAVRVLAAADCGRADCCGAPAHAWVRVEAWSPKRAFLTDAVPFAAAAGVPPGELAGRAFMAELDVATPPGNTDTGGERLEWPGLQIAPTVPAQSDGTPATRMTASTLMPVGGPELDQERARRLARALAPGAASVKVVVIPRTPPGKLRPRHTQDGHTYKADEGEEAATALYLRRAFRQPWGGNLAVGAVFFRPNRQRIDGDNLLKHVLDAGNRIAWHDDAQITASYPVIELDRQHPRTVLVVARHVSSMDRSDVGAKRPRGRKR